MSLKMRKLQQLEELENEEAEGDREFSVTTTGYDQLMFLRIMLTENAEPR